MTSLGCQFVPQNGTLLMIMENNVKHGTEAALLPPGSDAIQLGSALYAKTATVAAANSRAFDEVACDRLKTKSVTARKNAAAGAKDANSSVETPSAAVATASRRAPAATLPSKRRRV